MLWILIALWLIKFCKILKATRWRWHVYARVWTLIVPIVTCCTWIRTCDKIIKDRSQGGRWTTRHHSAVYFPELNPVQCDSHKSGNGCSLFSLISLSTKKKKNANFKNSIFLMMPPDIVQWSQQGLDPLPVHPRHPRPPPQPCCLSHSGILTELMFWTAEWQEGALASCTLLYVRCPKKWSEMLAQWGRMHLKYEIFPAGGYRKKRSCLYSVRRVRRHGITWLC